MKSPKFMSDLFADLRDRKLLPLLIVLPLATLAVPFLLKQDAPPPPSGPVAAAPVPEGAPTAAVLTSAPTLRDYRERLDQLRSKNPFAGQKLGSETPEGGEITESVAETGGSSGGGGSASFAETFNETVNESASGSGGEDVAVEIDESDGDTGGGSGGGVDMQWVEFQIDVETGPAGQTEERKGVSPMTILPSDSNPVAVYLGTGMNAKKALFMLSPDVAGTSGGGECSPSPSNCQVIALEEGEEQKFDYAPTGEPDTFVIELKRIRTVEVEDPRDRAAGARALDGATATSGAFVGD